jgi:hypothetical protein
VLQGIHDNLADHLQQRSVIFGPVSLALYGVPRS